MPCQPSGRRIWAISGLWWVGLAVTGDGRDAPVDGNSRFDDRPLRIAELCDVAR